jgi:hypothetical protein
MQGFVCNCNCILSTAQKNIPYHLEKFLFSFEKIAFLKRVFLMRVYRILKQRWKRINCIVSTWSPQSPLDCGGPKPATTATNLLQTSRRKV